ncbi:dTDP-4-dehydrorhamnose reductase [Paenibacillus piri]|uniref:dTDP-4-dehydrorhamnose reductase n=1 Tax=Paenibacillus piri TaxID=2547395 RepID=A0A4R5KPC5_9BACL|nr:dTDP-4-dehydrorhamnose reductase [Paenibacillus piri]TDF97559.1 dTDP-4-dehydrorhamnose reductase [Paenibacillus piri]
MHILITGAGGQLGCDLIRVLDGRHRLTAKMRDELDVADESAVREAVLESRPDAIIHAAAYTEVDAAESRPEEAYSVNSNGSRHIALAAQAVGAKLVYISTDYVFDGAKGASYQEHDRTNPLGVYGHSKLHGEKFVQLICDRYYIVRTSWLYGKYGSNFVSKVLALADRRNELSMVDDQLGSPTYTYDLAQFIGQLLESEHYGIYHASNRGCCSRYEFAREILRIAHRSDIRLNPVSGDAFPLPAARPSRSDLDDLAIRQRGFMRFRTWQEALLRFMLDDLGIAGGESHAGNRTDRKDDTKVTEKEDPGNGKHSRRYEKTARQAFR